MQCATCKGTGTETGDRENSWGILEAFERPCFECEGEGSVCSYCLASDCPGLYGKVQCPQYGKRQPDDFDRDGDRA